MKVSAIITHFNRKGYKVTRCWTGSVYVTQPNGLGRVFDNYSQAHRYYFGY